MARANIKHVKATKCSPATVSGNRSTTHRRGKSTKPSFDLGA
jgi:hypothetical protein